MYYRVALSPNFIMPIAIVLLFLLLLLPFPLLLLILSFHANSFLLLFDSESGNILSSLKKWEKM